MNRLFGFSFVLISILTAAPFAFAIHGGKLATSKGSRAVIGVRGDQPHIGCSGVVIHPRAFLIAAHCTKLWAPGQRTEAFFTSRGGASTNLHILNIYNHSLFITDDKFKKTDSSGLERATIDYDIAVVTLVEPIEDKYVLSDIPRLPVASDIKPDAFYMAVGMGMYRERGGAYLGDDQNSSKRELLHVIDKVQGTVLFMRSRVSREGVCYADSGGGILGETPQGERAVVVGLITAVAEFCGKENEYSYAESVVPHVDFIRASAAKDGISL